MRRVRYLVLSLLISVCGISAEDPKAVDAPTRLEQMEITLLQLKSLRMSGSRDAHLVKAEKSLKRALYAAKKKRPQRDPS